MQGGDEYIRWCARQGRGIRIVKPSERLGRQYAEKSHDAVLSMRANIGAGLGDWAVSASYYAMYFAVYSLLARVGIRCEIYDCTVAIFGRLFVGGRGGADLAGVLAGAKKDRVAAQYYTSRRGPVDDPDGLVADTCRFVADVEAVADRLDRAGIADVRTRLGRILSAPGGSA